MVGWTPLLSMPSSSSSTPKMATITNAGTGSGGDEHGGGGNVEQIQLITAGAAEGMPVSYRKPKMFFHGFTRYTAVLIIPFKCEWIITLRSFKFDLTNSREKFFSSKCDTHMF